MLVNKLQELDDITFFRSLPPEQLETILKDSPDHIAGIIADILLAFLLRSKVPANEAEEIAGKVREKKMGQLFADMAPIDIPAEQAKIRAQKQEIEAQRQEITFQQQEIDVQKQEIDVQKQEIDVQWQELDVQKQEIAARQQEIDAESKNITTQKQELEKMKQEIEAALALLKKAP